MNNNLIKRIITSIILTFIVCFSLYYSTTSWKIFIILISFICLYEFYNLIKRIILNKIFIPFIIILITLYLYFFYYLLVKIKIEYGEEAILILLTTCIFSDIGGYIVGKLIGGRKLISISPNKTISGAFGSVIFSLIGTTFFILLLKKINISTIKIEFSFVFYLWLLLMSLYCQIGDIFVSYLKRKAKVKDSGNILPGHGGILDRVDGIIFAIPLGVFTYYVLILSPIV